MGEIGVSVRGCAFATTFLPVPRLGLTGEAMDAIDLAGSGLWVSERWRVLAFGTFYYGFAGLLLLREAFRRMRADQPTGISGALEGHSSDESVARWSTAAED